MRKKPKKGIPGMSKAPVGKSLRELMKDEDGFVSKETILKVGLVSIAGLGALGAAGSAGADTHTNSIVNQGTYLEHSNILTHASY